MLFSATLDGGISVIAKRYLHDPVTHEADSVQSPISTMAHHVLHVTPDTHLPVLLDLVAAPGRTVVFTRTKHRAKKLARQLNGSGVPAVELHGNLSQNARTRTMDAFHSGAARTLVATDIAARGIHVDDVALVIHADPPVEHKAYTHRSGRTARAGASGTVITLMTDDQVRDVRDLTRRAGVRATTTRVHATHPLLQELAPGDRSFDGAFVPARSRDRQAATGRPRSTAEPAAPPGPAARGTGGQRRPGGPRHRPGPTRSGGSGAGGSASRPARRARPAPPPASPRARAAGPADRDCQGRALRSPPPWTGSRTSGRGSSPTREWPSPGCRCSSCSSRPSWPWRSGRCGGCCASA